MATLDEIEDVGLGDATTFPCAGHRVDIDPLLLREVSNSWSGQGFTTRQAISLKELITWRCCCCFVFDLVLGGNNILGWLCGCDRVGWLCSGHFVAGAGFVPFLFDFEHDVSDGDDLVVPEVDCRDLTRRSGRDLRH